MSQRAHRVPHVAETFHRPINALQKEPFLQLLTCHQEQQRSRLEHDGAAAASCERQEESRSHCCGIASGAQRVSKLLGELRPGAAYLQTVKQQQQQQQLRTWNGSLDPDAPHWTLSVSRPSFMPTSTPSRVASPTFSERLDSPNRLSRRMFPVFNWCYCGELNHMFN